MMLVPDEEGEVNGEMVEHDERVVAEPAAKKKKKYNYVSKKKPKDFIHPGRTVMFNVRSRARRSKPDYEGPHKLFPTDMDYIPERKSLVHILGSDKVKQYYRYFGKKDSRQLKYIPENERLDDSEEFDFYCYPEGAALEQHDTLLYPKIKDSRMHRWIRLMKSHPYKTLIDHVGINSTISEFEALYDMTHSRARGAYQKIVETWVSVEVFVLAYYPACQWATWLNQFAALEEEVRWEEPLPVEIVSSLMRAHGAKLGEWVTVNGNVQVPGRGAVWSTMKNYLSRIATFQTSIGHRNLSYDLHHEPTIANTLTMAKNNVNKNNGDLEQRAISFNVVLSLPYVCKGMYYTLKMLFNYICV